jgi:hypothetical protein
MKALGIFIITLCMAANLSIGGFLFYKGFIQEAPTNPNVSKIEQNIAFPEHGFSFNLPAGYEKLEPKPENSMVAVYVQQTGGNFNPTLQIYVLPDQRLWDTITAEKYKDYSTEIYKGNDKVQYLDGGSSTSTQGIYMYQDIMLEKYDADTYKEKLYTFYRNGKAITFLWADDPSQFDSSVASFDAIVNSITTL